MKGKIFKPSQYLKQFLALLLVIWIVVAGVRTLYNFSKVFTEERSWVILSDSSKRLRLFGDIYRADVFIAKNTPDNSNIVLLAPGGKTFFLSRYYLYPRRITYVTSLNELKEARDLNKFGYLVMFQTSDKGLNEFNSLSWKITEHPNFSTSQFDNKDAKLNIYIL